MTGLLLAGALLATSCGGEAGPQPAYEIPRSTERASAADAAPTAPPSAPRNTPLPPERATAPVILGGAGTFARGREPPRPGGGASVAPGGAISFNFVNADVREVAREILGTQLGLSYVVDPQVQATITAQTGRPLPREAVVPTLEGILRAAGLGLVEANGLYRILPLESAARAGAAASASPAASRAGYGIRVLPLRHVPAAELKPVLDPFVPPGGVLQVDGVRNMLVVSGPAGDLDGFAALVDQFDVDWLAGKSFGLFPLRVGRAGEVARELQAIFEEGGQGGAGPLRGLVRIVPIERTNAVMVIASQPSQLRQIRSWVERLDYGDDQMTPRLFRYYVQNSRAADLAAVLTELLSSGTVRTVEPSTAPGTQMTRLGPRGGLGPGPGLPAGPAGGAGFPAALPGSDTMGLPVLGQAGAPGAAAAGQPAARGGGSLEPGFDLLRRGGGDLFGGTGRIRSGLGPTGDGAGDLALPPVRIVADEKNNALVIYARPRDYRMIEEVVRGLDIVPLQVLIEATIAEVTLNDTLQYGVQYYLSGGSNGLLFSGSSGPPPRPNVPIDAAGVFPGFNYVLTAGNSRVVINLLSAITRVNVVSSPQLLVLDHQRAALQVGDQVPIVVQSAQSVINPDAPIVNSVQYRNTGVVLYVTPRVNSSGMVALDIDQEVSDVSRTTTSTINSPTIAQRRIVTSVMVQDGQTIALGGLIRDTRNDIRDSIPVLSDIPVIGPLFRQTTRSAARTELIVLLSPRVLRDPADARQATEDLTNRMRMIRPLGPPARVVRAP